MIFKSVLILIISAMWGNLLWGGHLWEARPAAILYLILLGFGPQGETTALPLKNTLVLKTAAFFYLQHSKLICSNIFCEREQLWGNLLWEILFGRSYLWENLCGRGHWPRFFTFIFWAFAPQGETTALPLKYPLAAYPCFATLNPLCFSIAKVWI